MKMGPHLCAAPNLCSLRKDPTQGSSSTNSLTVQSYFLNLEVTLEYLP